MCVSCSPRIIFYKIRICTEFLTQKFKVLFFTKSSYFHGEFSRSIGANTSLLYRGDILFKRYSSDKCVLASWRRLHSFDIIHTYSTTRFKFQTESRATYILYSRQMSRLCVLSYPPSRRAGNAELSLFSWQKEHIPVEEKNLFQIPPGNVYISPWLTLARSCFLETGAKKFPQKYSPIRAYMGARRRKLLFSVRRVKFDRFWGKSIFIWLRKQIFFVFISIFKNFWSE